MPADRTERKPTAYERICAEACPKFCGELRLSVFVLGKDRYHVLRNGARAPCTAPSHDAVIESQAAELARVAKERSEANAASKHLAKCLAEAEDDDDKVEAELVALKQERDELRAQIAKDERAHLNTIDERDVTEDWFGKLAALFGVDTEFSNLRGYADIYNDCAARTAQQEDKP